MLTLQEAADELGVHYMTAYRYVRLGQLDAHKVSGTWQVTEDAVEAFRTSKAPVEHPRRRPAPWSDRLEARLMAGDASGAWGVVEAALTAGKSVADVYEEMLTPALRSIGDRWANDEIDIAVEHRASGIAARLIGRLGPRCVRRGRRRGTIVIGAAPGERHALGVAILADLLRLEGWEVSDLGADTPSSSFVLTATETDDLAAVGISMTDPSNVDGCAATCAALRDAGIDVPIVVGGQGVVDTEHARSLGADVAAHDAEQFIAALESSDGSAAASSG